MMKVSEVRVLLIAVILFAGVMTAQLITDVGREAYMTGYNQSQTDVQNGLRQCMVEL
jgi:hypothetical protein